MKAEIYVQKFLENIESYAVDEEYDYTYYLISYELKRMQIPEKIGNLKPEHMSPILLFLRDWMLGGWVNWSERTGKRWRMSLELCQALNDLCKEFNSLDKIDLGRFDPGLHRKHVAKIFRTINNLRFASSEEAIATVTSKIIHLFSPRLLVMWDTGIIKDSGFEPNEDGYLEFLTKMKKLVGQLRPFLDQINIKAAGLRKRATEIYGDQSCSEKSLAKLIDENNWIESRKRKRRYR